jgi:hypothetical protein
MGRWQYGQTLDELEAVAFVKGKENVDTVLRLAGTIFIA